jgi:hypothetical protein
MAAWRRQAAAPVFASSALAQPVGRPSLSAASCSAAHAVAFATMLFHLCPPPFFFCSHGFAICRCSRMRARLPLPRVLLPHTCTQDGWFLQPKRRPVRLPRRTVPSNCICGVVECAPASLSPASSSLTHARRMDGFCNQNADQLGYLAGPSLLTVYVGVVECAPASPYTYSSSTHRFPDERTPIEATPLSATSAELGLGLGLGLGLDSLSNSSSHALPFFSPPSFHKLASSPAFTSVRWSA